MCPQRRPSSTTAVLDRPLAVSPAALPAPQSRVFSSDLLRPTDWDSPADYVRYLAGEAALARRASEAAPSERALIVRGAYDLVWSVVFDGLTTGIEHRRGHHHCARGVEHLEPDCLDRFEDDVEAVLEDLLRNGNVPIRKLEGWVRSRLVHATVDGNRRRRGERGALQRPRLPQWLRRSFGDDRWFPTLALDILTWVGVPATAGVGLWPYSAWAERRSAVTGDLGTTEQDVERDVEHVLAIMRRNAAWYERYVERPLGRKIAPLTPHEEDAARESHLAPTERHEALDTLQLDLAAVAMQAMASRFARGEDRRSVVIEVISTVFGSGLQLLDLAPGAAAADGDWVSEVLGDPEAVNRLVSEVCAILGVSDGL